MTLRGRQARKEGRCYCVSSPWIMIAAVVNRRSDRGRNVDAGGGEETSIIYTNVDSLLSYLLVFYVQLRSRHLQMQCCVLISAKRTTRIWNEGNQGNLFFTLHEQCYFGDSWILQFNLSWFLQNQNSTLLVYSRRREKQFLGDLFMSFWPWSESGELPIHKKLCLNQP